MIDFLSFTPLQYMLTFAKATPGSYEERADENGCCLRLGHLVFIGGEGARFLPDLLTKEKRKALGVAILYGESRAKLNECKPYYNKTYDNTRSLYALHAPGPDYLAEGVERITPALLTCGARNLSMITEEVLGTATYRNMDDFCERGVGFTCLRDNEIRGFCTSEYPTDASVAIGIEVTEACQRQGVASAMTSAMTKVALKRGFKTIYWDCWTHNEPSVRTALKCGFTLEAEYPALFVPFE